MTNPTADDIKHELKNVRYATGKGAWDSAEDMTSDISAELRRRGIPHAPARYDAGGNCLTCGECGRCPGVHTFEEIQKADRAQKGNRNMNKPTVKDLTIFKSITPAGQYAAVVLDGLRGEERQFFVDTIEKMADIWRDTPKTYETDGQGCAALARLHYFTGDCDWWIVEKDADPDHAGQVQAFGIADMGQGFREMGYINLPEIIEAGAELDFHFTPVTVGEILKGK